MTDSLLASLESAERGDRELDDTILKALRFEWVEAADCWSAPDDKPFIHERVSTSLDAALALAERVLPDTADVLHNICVWPTPRKGILTGPSARIFRQVRDPDAAGGWALASDNLASAATAPLALCIAILKATQSRSTPDGEG